VEDADSDSTSPREGEDVKLEGVDASVLVKALVQLLKPQKSAEGIDRQSIELVVKAVPLFPKLKGEVANWFDTVEAIMAALLNAASKHAVLTMLIGGERFALV